MKVNCKMFSLCILLWIISCSVFALSPKFFSPQLITNKNVTPGDYTSISGLWNFKNQPGYGFAAVFQNAGDTTYATGSREMGELVYGPFTIPDEPDVFLSFWYAWDTELSLNYDKMSVEVCTTGPDGTYTVLVNKAALMNHHPRNQWACMKWIDLTEYRNQIIYIRFFFDTVDSLYNNYHGWLVDHIMISRDHFTSVYYSQCILDISLDERDDTNNIAGDYSNNNHQGTISDPSDRHYLSYHPVNGYLDTSSSEIVIPSHPDFTNLGACALDCWLYPVDYDCAIAARGGQFLFYYLNDGRLRFYYFNGSSWRSFVSSTELPLNQWSFVSVLLDGKDQAVLYIDGELAGRGSNLGNLAPGSGSLYIGDSWGVAANFQPGTV